MATSGVEVGRNEVQLKHLGFVKILAINAVVLLWKLYGFAKQMTGPFKSTVEKVELVVTAVARPICYTFKEVPGDILVFLDNKVDQFSYIFDKHAPPIAKNVVSKARSIVEKTLDFMGPIAGISQAGNITKEGSSIFNDAVSAATKASDLVKEATQEGPIAGISHAGKEASNIFGGSGLSITKGVGSMVKKASDLVQEDAGKISKKTSNIFGGSGLSKEASNIFGGSGLSKEASNIFDGGALSITKGIGSMVKKTSDLVQEGPVATISQAGKEVSHIFDEGPLSITKGVGSMVKKASDLVQEGPIGAISDKISKETSHIFDEYAPSIAKNVVSTAGSMIKNASDLVQVARTEGPFAAISQAGKISKEFVVMQLVTLWFKANQCSFLYKVLEIVVPIATNLLKNYNNLVKHLKGKGCSLFSYFPLVPVEEMELAFKMMEEAVAASRRANELVEKAAAAVGRFG